MISAKTSGMPSSSPFLDLHPERAQLSDSLCVDVALIDRLLGTVLSSQTDSDLVAIARALYEEQHDEDPRTLFERVPQLRDAAFAQRLLRAYTILFQLINTAEQKEIVRANRQHYARAGAGRTFRIDRRGRSHPVLGGCLRR